MAVLDAAAAEETMVGWTRWGRSHVPCENGLVDLVQAPVKYIKRREDVRLEWLPVKCETVKKVAWGSDANDA